MHRPRTGRAGTATGTVKPGPGAWARGVDGSAPCAPSGGTVPSVTRSAETWLSAFAEAVGVEPPSEEESNELLALAGIAAHASERTAAPITCWLLARAGLSPGEGRETAQELAKRLGD